MGCIYVIDGVEYNEVQLKEYLANNLEAFSDELAGEESEVRGINKAANEMRRQYLNMESYDPDVITNFEANQKAEEWLKNGGDVNALLDKLEGDLPVSLFEQEVVKILNMELDAKIAENPTDELLTKQRRLTKINDIIGTDAARVLQARKGMPEPMTTISDYYIDKMNKNGVEVLTKAQKEEAKADFEKIAKLEKEVEELREQVNNAAAKELVQREINETKKSTTSRKATGSNTSKKVDYVAERSKVIGDIRQKLKNIREGRSGITSVPLPGVQEFIEIAPDVAKLARLYVQEGIDNLGDLVTKIHDVLRTELAGLTKQDVQDMIAGKYNKPRQTKPELQYKIENLKKEAKILNEIEEVKAGKPKTEKEEIKRNQRLADLNKQLVAAKTEAGYYDDIKARQAEKSVSKNIEDLKRRIEEKDFEVNKAERISSPKLEELRAEQKKLRDQLDAEKSKISKKDATEKRIQSLESELQRLKERRVKEKAERGSKEDKVLSEKEIELNEAIDKEKEKISEEKDRARIAANDYRKLETERNRQLQKVSDLKDKLKTLEGGALPETKKNESKKDVPEIEELKSEIKIAEKAVRESIAYQKRLEGLESELQRVKERKRKEKTENKRALTEQESDIRKKIEDEKLAWQIEESVERLTKELERVKNRKERVVNIVEKRALTDRENFLIDKIKEEKKAWVEENAPSNKLESAIDLVNNQIKEFERRIKEGDYSEKPKRVNILDDTELKKKNPELFNKLKDAREKLDDLKFEYTQKMAKEEMNSKVGLKRGVAETIKFTKEGVNTFKALKAGVDNSVVFIQNGLAVLNPMNIKATAKAFQAQADVAFSESNFRRRLVEIYENKELLDMVTRSGLDLIDPKGYRQSISNEQFGGQNWLDRIKFTISKKGEDGEIANKTYKASDITAPFERIFAAFSNEFRLQIFIRGAERLMSKGKTLDNNIEDFKSLASYANNITGRGKINNAIKSAEPVISALVWAPGLMSSSLNIMGLGDVANLGKNKGYYRAMTPEVRAYALKETAYGIAMGALIMAAMALDPDKEVDSDPTSVTFGQVKDTKNGWSYNLFGRFTPYIRFIAMMTLRGKMINGKPVKFDAKAETYKFFRGKAAPFTGVATDLMFSQNFQGKKYSLDDKGQVASDLFEPLFIKELRDQMKIDGTDAILTRAIPAFMGIKVVNEKMYDKRDLESLLNDTQVSSTMDRNLMVNYKEDAVNGKPVTKEEFNEFAKQRDELIGKYVSVIYEKGVPVLEGEKVTIKPISEISKEDLMKAMNKLKTLATKEVKKTLFGEKPEPEEYLREDLKLTWEDLGIGEPDY